EVPKLADQKYSIYLAGTNLAGIVDAKVGVDVGGNTEITKINYVNSDKKQDVVIRTNSTATSLTINGPLDDVKHYGVVGDLTVTEVRSEHCYHEWGFVKNLVSFGTGKFVVEPTALFHQRKDQVAALFEGKTDSYVEGKDAQYSQHIYNEDGVCVVDGCHETTATHVHSWGEYAHDETTHWRVCASCGAKETEEAHTLTYSNITDDTHDENCAVCGYSKTGVTHTFIDDKCACGAQDQNVVQINMNGTLTMSMGESVNIKFNWGSAVFWSLNSQSQGADNQYHETISNESISISNINVEQNTATVTAKKAGTNTVKVTYNEVLGASVKFTISVSGTAQTATIDPSKYNNQTLGSPDQVDHLVFGEYSKYADVWEGETYCIMDQAGEGTIRAYSVTYSVENSSDETVIYILSQSAMIYPQGKISSITAKFKNIKTIDLGNLDFSAATEADDFKNMFSPSGTGLTKLTTIFATAEQVAQMHEFGISNTLMFQECTSLVGGNGTEWSEHGYISGSHYGTKGYYAYIDGQGLKETSYKGYFTDRTQSPYYVPE
ncbi:MAG: hypothetical protein GX786_00315, partial [Clostridiales bacterium]|nr:hypothetical protein [Clostridiales bacterium]